MDAIEKGELMVKSAAALSKKDQILRFFILGLLSSGIDKEKFYQQFQESIEHRFYDLLQSFAEEGFLEMKENFIKLTSKGKRFSSHVGQFIAQQLEGEDEHEKAVV